MQNPRATCMVTFSVLLGAWAVFSCPGSSGSFGSSGCDTESVDEHVIAFCVL